MALHGLLNLDKPTGVTSRDVVDMVARPLRREKVGHAGTLDPLASGVLVVAVGAATRLIEYVQRMTKTYRAVVRLGARSDTLDADGTIVETPDPREPDEAGVRAALSSQVGTISQLPPRFSALKVDGRRAYDLARAGREVELAPREVEIHRIDLLSYRWPKVDIEVECGGGTYIRSIARDLGESLGCGGLIEVLVRTRIGPFALSDAIDPRGLSAESIAGSIRPMVEAVAGLPRIVLTAEQAELVSRGRPLDIGRLTETVPSNVWELALLDPSGRLMAIAEADPASRLVRPRRVLDSR